MKVSVDADRCRGHGVCLGISPEVFELTDDGYSVVLLEQPPQSSEERVRQAARQCPEQAISISS